MSDSKKNRVSAPMNYVALTGSERKPAKGATRVGAADPTERLSVRIYVRRRPDGPPMPDHEHWMKTPPGQRAFVSGEQFAQLYGASQEDLNKVQAFAASHGLSVVETNAESRQVVVSGTVAQMNEAFQVDLGQYESPTEKYRGREGQIQLPNDLVEIVQSVLGLDNRRVAQRHNVGGPAGAVALTPLQVASAYNFPSPLDATGQTVGIIELDGGYQDSDIKAFLSSLGLSLPTITPVPVTQNNTLAGSLANPISPDIEVALDIDVVAAIAQNADILVYFGDTTDSGFNAAMSAAINPGAGKTVPSVISCSWGGPEVGWTQMAANTMNQTLADAAVKGVTVFVASGDDGSDCNVGDGSAHVLYPTSDPGVTGCGGTFTILGPFSQGTWNDGGPQPPNDQPAGATGGGVSDLVFPSQPALPLWQQNANVPKSVNDNHVGRGVPDISGQASGYSGYVLTLYGELTTAIINPFTGSPIGPIGGTSEVAPLYAGLTAVMNAKLNQQVGFLNPSLYAFAEQPGFPPVFTDINDGVSNQWSAGAADAAHSYTSGPGWDACTGLGVIDGGALLSNLQALFQKTLTFVMQRDTFGQDEVAATGGVFQQAFFVTVDGLRPSDFPGGGITTLSPTQVQLNQWAPSIPDPAGPAGPTNITITPTAVSSDDPSLSPEVQRFTFTYQVVFPDQTAFTAPPASDFPEVLTLNATLLANTGTLTASQSIELIIAADPFFSSESNGGLYWLSEDIRTFYAVEGSKLFGAPALGNTPAAARSFIQWIISNISGPTGVGPNGDTFETTLSPTEQSSALSLLPTTMDTPHKNIYNFAIARVRLNGLSEKAKTVRAFFRLFQSQSVAVPYQSPLAPSGVSAPTGAYRQWSDGVTDGQKTPLLGISADGSEYITVPCFATQRVTDTSVLTNMTTQTDPPNVKPMTPVAGSTVYAYFGCWLDNNQSDLVFPFAPGANSDGPFTGQTLNTVSQVIDRGGHQCIVVEIVDDEAPIINNATPGTSDKIAQRNLAFTIVANPGLADSRLATHTFEIRPSPTTLNSDQRPDELMIDWGNVPEGSVASIYLPAVQAADVLALADRMYPTHDLTASDSHTLQSKTGGTTYIPIPQGSGPNYAGLFSVQLPLGVKHGQRFDIVVRQITSSFTNLKDSNPRDAQAVASRRKRFVYGSFQISIPVSVKSEMLIPEERNLSVLRWIQQSIPASSRWYPVFQRYIGQLIGRVTALGGNGNSVPPTQTGIWPGLPGTGKGTGKGQGHEPHGPSSFTGKVDAIIYDHFGDFEAFVLETFAGERHRFDSHEPAVHKLVQRAWAHRILTTVVVHHHRPERPIEIILHGAPPAFEE